MGLGRVASSCAAALAVAGCTVLVIGMSRADAGSHAGSDAPNVTATAFVTAPTPSQVRYAPLTTAAAAGSASSSARPSASSSVRPSASSSVRPSASSRPAPVAESPSRVVRRAVKARTPRAPAASTTVARPRAAPLQRGVSLPLWYSTGSATRVITVVAASTHSTTATLQAWTKAPGGGWNRFGGAVTAHVGADGLSSAPSEYKSATPIGSFTLTQAFGRYSDPGTALPYFQTTPADWWISQSGPLYNTHQHCWSGCHFTRGSPNEHLYYETPFYRYAVVIDYNTRNAPGGVRQGAGSAFFLHVTDGLPTAGCVAIGQPTLVSLMRWLGPAAHPRILIGVA